MYFRISLLCLLFVAEFSTVRNCQYDYIPGTICYYQSADRSKCVVEKIGTLISNDSQNCEKSVIAFDDCPNPNDCESACTPNPQTPTESVELKECNATCPDDVNGYREARMAPKTNVKYFEHCPWYRIECTIICTTTSTTTTTTTKIITVTRPIVTTVAPKSSKSKTKPTTVTDKRSIEISTVSKGPPIEPWLIGVIAISATTFVLVIIGITICCVCKGKKTTTTVQSRPRKHVHSHGHPKRGHGSKFGGGLAPATSVSVADSRMPDSRMPDSRMPESRMPDMRSPRRQPAPSMSMDSRYSQMNDRRR